MRLSYFILILLLTLPFQVKSQNGSIQIINNIDDVIIEDSTIFKINTASDSNIVYEIINYSNLNGQFYSGLVIKQNGHKLVEWLAIKNDELLHDMEAIDIRRVEWIKTCNLHNAEDLVNNFYSPDALYYNHKPLVQGTDSIIEEYKYMNNPNYSLNLIPLIVESINLNVVYEIGRCEGSYNGNYILIWKKNDGGEWRITFDSNI